MTSPSSSRFAAWRGLTTFDTTSGTAVLSFDIFEHETIRLRLPRADLEAVHAVVGDLLAGQPGVKPQSDRSSGSPSRLGSPQDGQNVCPPATSSAACCGVAYEPRSSCSNQGCQRPSRLWRMLKTPFRVRNAHRPATLDLPLTHANRLLDDSARFTAGEATRFLFDHYRCARPETQDAIVLALIGAMLTGRARRATGAPSSSTPSAASEPSS